MVSTPGLGFRLMLAGAGAKGVSMRIADDLIGNPMITAQLASEIYDVSYRAANNSIQRLVQIGILVNVVKGTIFACDPVLAALEH
jgi:Fic family protein